MFVEHWQTSCQWHNVQSFSPDLFGREDELAMLDEAWEDTDTNVISLVAFGGVGKSALVNVWLNGMEKDKYRGAERVYGWSFYSQGTREQGGASADEFINAALVWFGDEDPTAGSLWDKGERLAGLVKAQRDLDEAMTIATRGSMGLHEADCHLGYARLRLAMDEKDRARESLGIAKEMIDEMGYHRRDGEVEELEGELR